jgi:DNA-binding transcriptional LysR family regulator
LFNYKEGITIIETRLLNYFLAIAREQNITKAAESLHIAQPTLSKQMMDLEEQLGKKLFIRGKKKITLTEDGIYLRSRAQEITDLIEKTESVFKSQDGLVAGDIYLGCGETHIMEYITKLFKEMQTDYPEIHFHIYSGDAEAVMERLDKGLLDMGLLLGPIEQEKYHYFPLGKEDHFGLLIPKNSSLAAGETISLEALKTLPLIFPQQTYNGQQRMEWFGTNFHELNIIATYNLVYNATFMVEQEMGYAFCLENLVNIDNNRNLTFRRIEPSIKVEAYLITKKYQVQSTAAKVFLERLQESLKKE